MRPPLTCKLLLPPALLPLPDPPVLALPELLPLPDPPVLALPELLPLPDPPALTLPELLPLLDRAPLPPPPDPAALGGDDVEHPVENDAAAAPDKTATARPNG